MVGKGVLLYDVMTQRFYFLGYAVLNVAGNLVDCETAFPTMYCFWKFKKSNPQKDEAVIVTVLM